MMNAAERFIRLVEVHSDLAGARQGASGGIDALIKRGLEKHSSYFEKYPAEVILHENEKLKEPSAFAYAKYIDSVGQVIERIAQRICALRQDKFFPIVIAADHSSAAGTMAGLKLAHPDDEIGVVYIDAHADIHTPYTTPSGNMHGMPLAIATALDNDEEQINAISTQEREHWERLKALSKVPAIKPENIVFCALRDFEPAEEALIKKHDIAVYDTQSITYIGIQKVCAQIFALLEHCQHIYVSFDVDSIDPLFIPGTGTPAHGGLSFEQALQLNLELIKNTKVCCWEMAEINPLYDKNNISSEYSFMILERVTQMLIKNY